MHNQPDSHRTRNNLEGSAHASILTERNCTKMYQDANRYHDVASQKVGFLVDKYGISAYTARAILSNRIDYTTGRVIPSAIAENNSTPTGTVPLSP